MSTTQFGNADLVAFKRAVPAEEQVFIHAADVERVNSPVVVMVAGNPVVAAEILGFGCSRGIRVYDADNSAKRRLESAARAVGRNVTF